MTDILNQKLKRTGVTNHHSMVATNHKPQKEKEKRTMATMITRTVVGTSITAKVVNKNTDEVTTFSSVVSKVVTEEKDAVKALSKVIPSELVIINIVSCDKVEKLYGMTVADFMAHSVELDPATRKPLPAPATPATEEI